MQKLRCVAPQLLLFYYFIYPHEKVVQSIISGVRTIPRQGKIYFAAVVFQCSYTNNRNIEIVDSTTKCNFFIQRSDKNSVVV